MPASRGSNGRARKIGGDKRAILKTLLSKIIHKTKAAAIVFGSNYHSISVYGGYAV